RQTRCGKDRATAEDQSHTRAERHRIPEVLRGESADERPENRSESLNGVVRAERLRSAVLRSEARHEDGARDVDQGPAEADARMNGDRDAKASAIRKGRHPDEQERWEQHRPAKGRVQLRRPVASTRDPAADPWIHRDRGCLARDVHGDDFRASEAVRLLQEDREESVESGEASEEEEHAYEIDSQRARQPDLLSPVERVEEMQDPNGQIAAPLDPSMNIGDVDLPAIHPDRRFASPHLSEEPREKAKRRANHEERAHRRDLRGEQSRTNDEPCDPEGQAGDPANRCDAAHECEPRKASRRGRTRTAESRPRSRHRRPLAGGTSRTNETRPSGPSHPFGSGEAAHSRRRIRPFLRSQRRSNTSFAAAMNRTMMKINATDRVLNVSRPHRDPTYAPTKTTGIRIGMRTNSAGHAKPPGRSARSTTYATKPTAAVGMMSSDDVPIAFRVFRPRTYTSSGTFSRPPPIPMLPDRKPDPVVAAAVAATRGGVIAESTSSSTDRAFFVQSRTM